MSSSTWKQAWWMAKTELKRERFYWIWTILFTLYVAFISGSIFTGTGVRTMEPETHTILADNLFLLFVPFLGFFFSRRSCRYLQDDSYTRMLSYMRRMPIPVETILWSRIFQMVICFVINGIFFFTVIYLFLLRQEGFRLDQVLSFSLLWIGYSLFSNAIYTYWEFLTSGKIYFVFTLVSFVLLFLVTLITAVLDWNVIWFTVEQSRKWGLLSPGMWIMLVLGTFMTIIIFHMIKRKLGLRDLS